MLKLQIYSFSLVTKYMARWYKVEGYKAHQGAGSYTSVTVYIFAEDATQVLQRYQIVRGVKRDFRHRHFPNVFPLSPEASEELEKRINSEGKIPLDEAKRKWYSLDLI